MYENENRNMNGLGNDNMEHRDVPETTVNWTTPGDGRSQQRQNTQSQDTQSHNTQSQNAEGQRMMDQQAGRRGAEGQYAQGQGSQGPRQPHTQGPDTGFIPYGSRANSQDGYGGNSYQGYQGGDNQRNHSSKGRFAKRVAGITAAAVLFGTVSGGVMPGVNYLGNRPTGAYGTAGAPAETQARNQIGQAAPANTQASGNQGTTAVSAVTDVSGIVENAMPSIVAINDTMTVEQRDFFGMPQTYTAQSSSSGIIVNQTDTELLIATNNHVVDGASDLKVTFVDNKDVSAAVKGTDSASDLAIIAVQLKDIPSDTMSKIKVATLGNSDEIKVGQQVIAIGNALGYGQSVTVGYVSALDREITDKKGINRTFIQTDAAINPGNSGGALIDLNGNVIGINAAKTASTEVEGMGFAIPISKAQDILNSLMTKKTRVAVSEDAQGYLGIQGTNIDAATSQMYGMPVGIYVYKIVEGGAAASSDLKEKDIITKFDGQSVTSMEELKQMLTYYEGGAAVTLTVQSLVDGAYVEHDVQVTLGTRPAAQS
ncbi:MAG: trypsin-like peptidase domain-containing protein [Clostridia bacterium]|nr:trypsin-like peptidase domain-containing protein [Clostridia bacterium]